MNGLLMSKLNDINLNIILLNNDGGGIFSFLPQKSSADIYFERLFGTPDRIKLLNMLHYFMIFLTDVLKQLKLLSMQNCQNLVHIYMKSLQVVMKT